MPKYLARESSSGDIHVLNVRSKDREEAYKLYGKEVLGMEGEIDTGDVDIDLIPLPEPKSNKAVKVDFDPKGRSTVS